MPDIIQHCISSMLLFIPTKKKEKKYITYLNVYNYVEKENIGIRVMRNKSPLVCHVFAPITENTLITNIRTLRMIMCIIDIIGTKGMKCRVIKRNVSCDNAIADM